MWAPLPGVKVAGADVVGDLAGAEPVGAAGVVLLTLENGAGAGVGVVIGVTEAGADETGADEAGADEAGADEAGADEAAGAEVEAGVDAATAEPLGFVQAMVSM